MHFGRSESEDYPIPVACAFMIVVLFYCGAAEAQSTPLALASDATKGQSYTLSIQILVLMTLLTLLPAAVLSTSAFIRIIIVLSILRQALGTAQTPPNQVLLGIALFLTFFVMSPVINEINETAAQPYIDGQMSAGDAFTSGIKPLRQFMIGQTRESDLQLFASIAGRNDIASIEEAPLSIIIPSFMVSELKTAFQIGFLVFIPFLDHRSCCLQRLDVDGNDDALANDRVTAVQNNAVRDWSTVGLCYSVRSRRVFMFRILNDTGNRYDNRATGHVGNDADRIAVAAFGARRWAFGRHVSGRHTN